ncbi:MAG: hypothetical protein NTX53_16305 [candidate division WOR-3 bacterium]|nr:hypothetical protein [candidate division WOR-3 bacterium]
MVIRLLLAAGCLLWATGSLQCARQVVSPSARPVRVFVTDARLDRLPAYAAEVRAHQALSPTIWLVTGDLFADKPLAVLSDGAAQLMLLNRAGVDAVVLTPDWLSFGLPRMGQMVSGVRFYALSASLLDATGSTLGHPFMVKKSGSANLALTGLALDSTNVLTRMTGIRYAAPDFAARKALALMRQRADFVGVMVEPNGRGSRVPGLRGSGPRTPEPQNPRTLSVWGADFTVNTGAPGRFAMVPSDSQDYVNCYDVAADADRLTAGACAIDPLRVDSTVSRVLDSLKSAADSVAASPFPLSTSHPGPWTPERLSNVLVQGLLVAKLADGFMCDSLFVADFKEPTDVGALVSLLRDPGRLAILAVTGDALAGWPKELMLRPGLSRTALSRGLTYRIATTVDYLQRNPQIAAAGFELSHRPFWTICRDILESGRVK